MSPLGERLRPGGLSVIGNSVPDGFMPSLARQPTGGLRPTHRYFQLEVRFLNLGFSDSRQTGSTGLAVRTVEWNRFGTFQEALPSVGFRQSFDELAYL